MLLVLHGVMYDMYIHMVICKQARTDAGIIAVAVYMTLHTCNIIRLVLPVSGGSTFI